MGSIRQMIAAARPGRSVVGWKLFQADRRALLERFRPKYSRTIADHVTLAAMVAADKRCQLKRQPLWSAMSMTGRGSKLWSFALRVFPRAQMAVLSTLPGRWHLGVRRRKVTPS